MSSWFEEYKRGVMDERKKYEELIAQGVYIKRGSDADIIQIDAIKKALSTERARILKSIEEVRKFRFYCMEDYCPHKDEKYLPCTDCAFDKVIEIVGRDG